MADELERIEKSDEEWRAKLTPAQYRVTRQAGTERPFSGEYTDTEDDGTYRCVCCGLPLFSSAHMFHSGSGWPSFFQPIAPENLIESMDASLGSVRTEITCTRCLAHLGHVFPDGPPPTGQRHCLNSESLSFTEIADVATLADPATTEEAST